MLCKLKDIIHRVKDNVDAQNTELEFYIGGEHFDNREVLITKKGVIKGSTIGPAFHMRFKPGQVLLMSRNPHLRKAGMVDFEGICSDVSYVCETNDERKFKQRLIPFLFQSDIFWETAEANKKGSTNFFLNWSDFEKFEFNVPEPEEQEKLAELLWTAEETRQKYKKLIKQVDEVIKSQFIEMFGDIKNNIKGYPIRHINEFSNLFAGATPSTKVSAYWEKGTIPWMSSGEVHMGHVVSTEKKISQLGYDKCSTKMVPLHSVVIALAGQGKTRGTVAITDIELCTNQSLCAIVTNDTVLSDYLYHNLKYRYEEIRNMCAIADGRGGLNLKIVGSINVIVPPVEEQRRFIAFLQQAEQTKLATQQSLDALNETVRALVNRNFN